MALQPEPNGWETRGSVAHRRDTWQTLDECWRAGDLRHLLDETQRDIYDFIRGSTARTLYVSASRQLGKSFVDVVLGIEEAIRHPGKRVNYVAKTFGSLSKMMEGSMALVIEQAPPDCRPVFVASRSRWVFPASGPGRGAFIQLVGADDIGGADTARGGAVVFTVIDEAGFIDCLEYLLNSVLKPMGLRSLAQTVLSTSPALSPDHYSCQIEDACAAQGALITRDYWSPGLLSREQKVAFLEGEASALNLTLEQFLLTSTYKREYGCQRVLDTTLAVVPEFPEVRAAVVEAGRVAVRPPFFDLYFAGDPGMDDLFGGLFGYLDFRRHRFVVEYELLLAKANTSAFADAWRELMKEAYPCEQADTRSMRIVTRTDAFNVVRPFSAVLDDSSKRICADLFTDHGLSFAPALKDDREAAINQVRVALTKGVLEIHPRCTHLIAQLGSAIRKKPGGEMAHSRLHGHYDLVASLWYLVRSIVWSRNPYPLDYSFNPKTMTRRPPPQSRGLSMAEVLAGKKR